MADIKETTYFDDIKQRHIVFSNLWYIEGDTNESIPAKLELFGHSYAIGYSKEKYTTTIQGSKVRGSQYSEELTYCIIKSDGTTITLDLGNFTYVRLSLADFKLLKAFYDEKNLIHIQAEKLFKDQILSMLPKLFDDLELMQMVSNFIEEMPTVICYDPIFIVCTECLIAIQANKGNVGNSLFLSDEFQRSAVSIHERVVVEKSPTESTIGEILHIKNEDIIKPYLNNGFFLLVKLIKDRFYIGGDVQAIYLTYVFLYKAMIHHFSQKWASEYNDYFRNIDDLTLSEAIQQYWLIETINRSDPRTGGTFLYYLLDHGKFGVDNYLLCIPIFVQKEKPLLERQKAESFSHKIKQSPSNRTYSINDIDLMSGQEFEQFLAALFSKMGYETALTKSSGDQGIDVIASKVGIKLGIQAKCYSGSVGNGAIQEAVAGRTYYHLDKAIVVTNAGFTNSAKELAQANSVVLWDRTILKDKITELW